MRVDLFKEKISINRKRNLLEKSLSKYDRNSFRERLKRLKFIYKIFPKNYWFISDIKTMYIFDETKMAFINGEFVAVLMLSLAYIERKTQLYLSALGFAKESKRGLKFMVDFARENNLLSTFLLKKVDLLRNRRNPFSHLKDCNHKFNISQRILKEMKEPLSMLERDAYEAISLMYFISTFKFSKPIE